VAGAALVAGGDGDQEAEEQQRGGEGQQRHVDQNAFIAGGLKQWKVHGVFLVLELQCFAIVVELFGSLAATRRGAIAVWHLAPRGQIRRGATYHTTSSAPAAAPALLPACPIPRRRSRRSWRRWRSVPRR